MTFCIIFMTNYTFFGANSDFLVQQSNFTHIFSGFSTDNARNFGDLHKGQYAYRC